MIHRGKLLLTAGLLLVLLGTGQPARADDGCGDGCGSCGDYGGCCGKSGMGGLFAHKEPVVTWYAPYPYWWPQYFGPPHSDYAPVVYITPPAESALIVKERILAINSATQPCCRRARNRCRSPNRMRSRPRAICHDPAGTSRLLAASAPRPALSRKRLFQSPA
jgi:hypothetical protein